MRSLSILVFVACVSMIYGLPALSVNQPRDFPAPYFPRGSRALDAKDDLSVELPPDFPRVRRALSYPPDVFTVHPKDLGVELPVPAPDEVVPYSASSSDSKKGEPGSSSSQGKKEEPSSYRSYFDDKNLQRRDLAEDSFGPPDEVGLLSSSSSSSSQDSKKGEPSSSSSSGKKGEPSSSSSQGKKGEPSSSSSQGKKGEPASPLSASSSSSSQDRKAEPSSASSSSKKEEPSPGKKGEPSSSKKGEPSPGKKGEPSSSAKSKRALADDDENKNLERRSAEEQKGASLPPPDLVVMLPRSSFPPQEVDLPKRLPGFEKPESSNTVLATDPPPEGLVKLPAVVKLTTAAYF